MTTVFTTSARPRDVRAEMCRVVARERVRLERFGESEPWVSHVVLLDYAVDLLRDAAAHDDLTLASACRGILDALAHPGDEQPPGVPADHDPQAEAGPVPGSGQVGAEPQAPPAWAERTLAEDGGITHELASPWHPTVRIPADHGWYPCPTDVALSVIDVQLDGQWIRTRPTVCLEGGRYTMAGVRDLLTALQAFLALVETTDDIGRPAT